MNVQLVSVTRSEIQCYMREDEFPSPGELPNHLSPEQLITYTARVSNPGNQHNHETADKLIAYLIKNKHWSPFEMVSMCVEIKTSRAIAQQILRHRSFSFQEFSQRYAKVVDMEPVQLRKQAEKNRQSSTEAFDPVLPATARQQGDEGLKASVAVQNAIKHCEIIYQELIKAGVAKECARMVLPLTTQTTIYMTGTVRSWIHYLQQRIDPHTQLEHQQVAQAVLSIFVQKFPNIAVAVWPNGFQ